MEIRRGFTDTVGNTPLIRLAPTLQSRVARGKGAGRAMKAMRALVCGIVAAASLGTLAQDTPSSGASRVALVIGNAKYHDSPLLNPVNDARSLSSALRAAGFEVIELHDQGSAAMRRAIREFGEKLRGKDAGLFYFAGHGVQVRGRNYLVPVDADIKYEDEIEDQSVETGLVLAKMESAKARVNLVILDACRNNPFARSQRSAQNGLAPMEAPLGTLVAFATSPGQVASDGGAQGNGLYTTYLVREMTRPGLKVEDVFKRVRAAVRVASAGRQIPWENTSLEGDFYFHSMPATETAVTERERARRQEEAVQAAVASALTVSREEAEREKKRLEAQYAERLEAERAAFRKEAGDRIAALEKAALAANIPVLAAAPPARPAVVDPKPATEEAPEPIMLALGVDTTLRNKLHPVSDDAARGLKRNAPGAGDQWTYYRTIRDGEGTQRRNYVTRIVVAASAAGYTIEQSDAAQPAQFDLDGNQLSGPLRSGMVTFEPMDPVFRFPLTPGARWETKSREALPSHAVEVDSTITVGGWEEVTVPAGRFNAVKISRVSYRRGEPFPGQMQVSKRVSSYWYLPALRNIVRFEALEVTDRGAVTLDQTWELDSFELRTR
jgi:uncharacterized caspase-like protein